MKKVLLIAALAAMLAGCNVSEQETPPEVEEAPVEEATVAEETVEEEPVAEEEVVTTVETEEQEAILAPSPVEQRQELPETSGELPQAPEVNYRRSIDKNGEPIEYTPEMIEAKKQAMAPYLPGGDKDLTAPGCHQGGPCDGRSMKHTTEADIEKRWAENGKPALVDGEMIYAEPWNAPK